MYCNKIKRKIIFLFRYHGHILFTLFTTIIQLYKHITIYHPLNKTIQLFYYQQIIMSIHYNHVIVEIRNHSASLIILSSPT